MGGEDGVDRVLFELLLVHTVHTHATPPTQAVEAWLEYSTGATG